MVSTRWPLSAAQASIWFAHQLDPSRAAYNVGGYLEIHGPLNASRFAQALARAVAETDAFHVRFGADDGEPWQILEPSPATDVLRSVDLSAEPDPGCTARSRIALDLAQPIDLTTDPLYAAELLILGPELSWAYFRFHHIIMDGYGLSLVGQRVAEIYNADPGDGVGPNAFTPLTRHWAADSTYLASAQFSQDRQFWLSTFADRPTPPALAQSALAQPAVAAPAHQGVAQPAMASWPAGVHVAGLTPVAPGGEPIQVRVHRCAAALSSADIALLTAAAARDTWPSVLVAAAAVYAHRLTGSPDIVVGLPSTGRWGRAARQTPGMFATVIPLRLAIQPGLRLGDVVRSARESVHQGLRHQRYRLEELRTELKLTSEAPLISIAVNVMPFDFDLPLDGCRTVAHVVGTGPVAELSLDVYGSLASSDVRIELSADAARHTPADLIEHRDRFVRVLSTLCADPDRRVGDVAILDPAEQVSILSAGVGQTRIIADTTVSRIIETQVSRAPSTIALVCADEELSYAELNARANRLARELLAHGVRPEQVVALALPRCVELVVALLAVLKSGAAYLPIDLAQPSGRIRLILDDADPALVLTTRSAAAANQSLTGRRLLVLDDAVTAEQIARHPILNPADDDRHGPIHPLSPAYLLFTSGSTGRPKGVVVGHQGLLNHLLWLQDQLTLSPADRVLLKTPADFDVSVWELLWPLMVGAAIVVARPGGHADPAYLAELIIAEQVTVAGFVPSMLRVFLREPRAAQCRGLTRTLCIGEALPADLVQLYADVLGSGLHNLYGPTEASVAVTSWRCQPLIDEVPLGQPAWNTQVHVLDRSGQPAPLGVVGELHLAGAQLARGYLNRPGLTADRFVPNPYGGPGARMYRTGDLVRRTAVGDLVFVGRVDDQVKIRGVRVEPGEVASVLTARPDVDQAVVTVADDHGGERWLVAYVVPAAGHTLPDPSVLRGQLAADLPAQLVPAAIIVLDTLPMTANGKLNRGALPVPEFGPAVPGRAPRTWPEVVLCGLFAEALELPRVGVDDSFFDLGGHSLRAARLADRIRSAFGIDADLRTVFDTPTVAGLAQRFGGRLDDAASTPTPARTTASSLDSPLPLRSRGERDPVFCVHPVTGLSWCYSTLLRHLTPDRPVYGLQSRGLARHEPLPGSVEEMASDYAQQIRAVQPHGPYHLIGWSLGGIVAFATATELCRRGEQVALLGLLDAYPHDPQLHTEEHRRALLDAVLADFGYDPALLDGLDRADLGKPAALADERVVAIIRQAGGMLVDWGDDQITALLKVAANNLGAVRRFTPTPFNGDLHFFTATHSQPDLMQTVDVWRPYVSGQLLTSEIACRHEHMMRPAHIAEVATVLAAALTTDLAHQP